MRFQIGVTSWTVPAGGIGPASPVSGETGPELEYEITVELNRPPLFRLFDDDQTEAPFNIDRGLILATDSPKTNAFAPAYLVPRVFMGPGGRIARFDRNVECPRNDETHCETEEALETLALGRDGPKQGDGFLVAYLLGAFQGPETEDGDPTPEGDRTNGQAYGSEGAMVFLEAQREGLSKCLAETPAHEVGHLLNLYEASKNDFNLMSRCSPTRGGYFSPGDIQRIREAVKP